MENYKLNLWNSCQGAQYITSLKCKAWRVVEDQSRSSTRELVDTLEEHEILEDLIEHKSKPALPKETEFQGLHYLLFTPFRYPPLRYGSRFGQRCERALWYGAQELETSLGEAAFYRFLFFAGTAADLLPIITSHSVYSIDIQTNHGIALDKTPFKAHHSLISQKSNYEHSQLLGSAMRQAEIEAFSYFSARIEGKVNLGIFTPVAFSKKTIDVTQHWQCYTNNESVEFIRNHLKPQKIIFNKEQFLVNQQLPFDHEA